MVLLITIRNPAPALAYSRENLSVERCTQHGAYENTTDTAQVLPGIFRCLQLVGLVDSERVVMNSLVDMYSTTLICWSSIQKAMKWLYHGRHTRTDFRPCLTNIHQPESASINCRPELRAFVELGTKPVLSLPSLTTITFISRD